jgi:predicted lipoprotein with Yx(FWY)xxD motif
MRRRLIVIGVLVGALVICASALALLKFDPTSLKTGKVKVGGKQETIVVDNRGVTVYELGGESAGKLLCDTNGCLKDWIPVRTSGAKALPIGKGVPGPSGFFHRVQENYYQAMLDHHQLYYFSGDSGKAGSAKGNGIHFNSKDTWHVVKGT